MSVASENLFCLSLTTKNDGNAIAHSILKSEQNWANYGICVDFWNTEQMFRGFKQNVRYINVYYDKLSLQLQTR